MTLIDELRARGIRAAIFDDDGNDAAPRTSLVSPRRSPPGIMNDPPPQSARDVLDQIFAGRADPRLSADQNERIARDARLTAGLTGIVASQNRPGLQAIATGALAGRRSAAQATQSAVVRGLREDLASRVRNLVNKHDSFAAIPASQLFNIALDAQALGQQDLVALINPHLQNAIAAQREAQAHRIQQLGMETADRLIEQVNTGERSRAEAEAEVLRLRADGDPSADVAYSRLRGDSKEAQFVRNELRDDFLPRFEQHEWRLRAAQVINDPNSTPEEVAIAMTQLAVDNPRVDRNSFQTIVETDTRAGFLKPLADAIKTAALTDEGERTLRRRGREMLPGVLQRLEADVEAVTRAANASRVLVEDLGLPSLDLAGLTADPAPPLTREEAESMTVEEAAAFLRGGS